MSRLSSPRLQSEILALRRVGKHVCAVAAGTENALPGHQRQHGLQPSPEQAQDHECSLMMVLKPQDTTQLDVVDLSSESDAEGFFAGSCPFRSRLPKTQTQVPTYLEGRGTYC